MGSSGEEPNKGIDATAGGLVWVRRRNGAWWPGKILGPDELPEGSVPTPRSGTPIKLLGREDASVDWYNLEKSKRVKAFHCEEYDDCIKKVKASASHPSKKAAKYARREDAILHALELENARVGKDHPVLSATPVTQDAENHHVDESPSASPPSEESEDDDEDLNGSGDDSDSDSDSGRELSESGISFDGPDHVDSAKEESKRHETPNDSEDDGSEGVKRMKGLEDLGMGVASSLKRKRSQVGHVQEFLKRKNRHRPLTKVMECATIVPVPVARDRLSVPTGASVLVAPDIKVSGVESNESKKNNSVMINNNSYSNGVSCENRTPLNASKHASDDSLKHKQIRGVPENGSFQKLFDVPLVAEEKKSGGLSSIVPDVSAASQPTQVGAGVQSSQSSHVEAMCLGNEEYNESGSTSSGTANVRCISPSIEKGTFEWRLKGKRNSRSRKVDSDNEAETYVAGADRESFLAGSSRNVGSNNLGRCLISDRRGYPVKPRPITGIQVEEFRGWSWNAPPPRESYARGSTAEPLVPQRLLPFRQSRFTVNPKYDSDYSLGHRVAVSGLYDVDVEVKTSYRPQHVPYISLMSKLTGRPVIGHPLAVKVLKDGSCDKIMSKLEFHSSCSEFDYNQNEDTFAPESVGKRRGRGRPPSKHGSSHARSSQSKSSKSRRNGLLPKKTRKLSSLTSSHRLSREETKPVVEKLKGPSIACVPLKIVFSRINAALTSSVRTAPRLNATSST